MNRSVKTTYHFISNNTSYQLSRPVVGLFCSDRTWAHCSHELLYIAKGSKVKCEVTWQTAEIEPYNMTTIINKPANLVYVMQGTCAFRILENIHVKNIARTCSIYTEFHKRMYRCIKFLSECHPTPEIRV